MAQSGVWTESIASVQGLWQIASSTPILALAVQPRVHLGPSP